MPPKVAKTEDGDPNFKFVFSVLKHCESVKPVWENVAKENGIGYGKNAQAKFKNIVEKHGFKFEGGRIMVPGEEGASTPASAKTANTPKTPKSAAAKRKAAAVEGDVANETPTKTATKKKPAKTDIKIKEEGGDDGHGQVAVEVETNGAVKNGATKEAIKKKPVTNGDVIKKEADGETLGAGIKLEAADENEDIDDDVSLSVEEVGDMIS